MTENGIFISNNFDAGKTNEDCDIPTVAERIKLRPDKVSRIALEVRDIVRPGSFDRRRRAAVLDEDHVLIVFQSKILGGEKRAFLQRKGTK